jgi:hypothetical protein
MDELAPHAAPCGVRGTVVQIWQQTVHGRRAAVTVEIEDENTWWVLWMHVNDRWEHQLFCVLGWDRNDEWHPLYGEIRRAAMVHDGSDMFLVLEHLGVTNQFVWLVYAIGEREPGAGEEALLLLEIWVPVDPDWENDEF